MSKLLACLWSENTGGQKKETLDDREILDPALDMRALSGLLPDDLDKAMRRNVQGAVETFWPVLRPGGSYGT
jgi:hypothetical protein